MNIPAAMATKFPSTVEGPSWSKKNSAMPASTTSTTARSGLRISFLYSTAEKSTMNTGAVNCSTMALAAVVSLFASAKQI